MLVGWLSGGRAREVFLPRNRRVTANLAREMRDLAREPRDLTAQAARFEPTTNLKFILFFAVLLDKVSTIPRQFRITLDERS